MTSEDHAPGRLISYAQNGEDIVLWRALGHISAGNYIDVGAADPISDSVTKVFYEHGWSGIDIDPLPQYARALSEDRERDLVVEAGVSDVEGTATFYGIPKTGLSSLSEDVIEYAVAHGFEVTELRVNLRPLDDIAAERFSPGDDIHFLKVDVEGAEEAALRGFDLKRWRPWVVVVEATEPNSSVRTRDTFEYLLTDAGYEPTLFDGLNVFYLSPDHPELRAKLSYPANPVDPFIRHSLLEATRAAADSHASALSIEAQLIVAHTAIEEQKRKAAIAKRSAARQKKQLNRYRNSPWWRLTAPGRHLVARAQRQPRPGRTNSPKQGLRGQGLGSPTATRILDSADVLEIRESRLRAMFALYSIDIPDDYDLADLIARTIDLLQTTDDQNSLLWLLHILIRSEFPTDQEMFEHRTRLDQDGPAAQIDAMVTGYSTNESTWATTAAIEFIEQPFVDVSHTSRVDVHTGIQRVVRETCSRWAVDHDIALATVRPSGTVWRRLDVREEHRILRWGTAVHSGAPDHDTRTIAIPWNTRIVLPELSGERSQTDRLSAIANWSNSKISAISYDLTPFVMAEACTPTTLAAFGNFMSVIRVADRISTISESVAHDLRGFFTATKNLGLTQPSVCAQLLPIHAHEVSAKQVDACVGEVAAVPGLPVVLAVSSIQPRKNQAMILAAAEELWREGHGFQLVFIAGDGWDRGAFDALYQRAVKRGRPVRVITEASEDLLWSAYRIARFTVFISLAEGFGLPAAESIAVGTPVVLTNYGSMREIGADGGAEFVDPRDSNEVFAAMKLLLTDDEHLNDLRAAATSRVHSSWDDYAKSTWDWLISGQ